MSRKVRCSATFAFIITISTLTVLVSAGEPNGPLAAVTIWDNVSYSTAKRCAANCVSYDGVYDCIVHAYYDLGIELGCGCASINGCYCNTAMAKSASEFLSTCISSGCAGNDAGWTTDRDSMIALYNAYCLTANVAASSTKATTTSDTLPGSTNTDGASPTSAGASAPRSQATTTASQTAAASQSTSTDSQKSSDEGLSRSDIVALAASLGVGIPSLLIAAITLCVQLKKRKKKKPPSDATIRPQVPNGWLPYNHHHQLKA